MKADDTPLIRPSEKRNASAWFYGIGAVLAVLTLLLVLLGIPFVGDPADSTQPPAAAATQ